MNKQQLKQYHPLALACYKQIGADSIADFIEKMGDVASHGANTGWSGFTYSADCKQFYLKNKAKVHGALYNDIIGGNYHSIIELVKSFRCLNNYTLDDIGEALFAGRGDPMIFDALAWYALESVAHALAYR